MPERGASFSALLVRDLVGATAALACWVSVLGSDAAPNVLAQVLTVGLTLTCILSTHEWGHWLGARLSGATLHPPSSLLSPFVFAFDTRRSSRRQFFAMSLGGYVTSGLMAGLLACVVPRELAFGQALLAITAIGLGLLALDDLPVVLRVARGGPMPSGGLYARDTAPIHTPTTETP